MRNRTHRAVGAAVALAIVGPQSLLGCAATVAAGAMGGAVSDVDLLWRASAKQVLRRTLEAALVLGCIVAMDLLLHAGVSTSLEEALGPRWGVGAVMMAALVALGFFCEHRGFTHSLLGMTLFSWAVRLIVPEHAVGFMAGFAAHLALDLLNRSPLKLLYPFRTGFTLRLFSAEGVMDVILWIAGWLVTAGLVVYYVMT